ncbi:MAG: lipopolysaccharide heptosyltransferase II [Verrucomicrobia bacterium]|nr:lipopolysaccharide heptosyltransferase II [Verrucomicrobiota bacterium]
MKILILKPSSLGDVIQALPVLRLLKAHFPASEIHWWIASNLVPLLADDPDLAGLFLFERQRWQSPWHWHEMLRSVREMRAQCFDWVIDLQGLARSGAFAWLANGGLTIGIEDPREGAAGFYDVCVRRPSPGTHAVDWYLEVLSAFKVPRHWNFEWLASAPKILEQVRQKWQTNGSRWIVLNPGARWANKRWPTQHFAAITNRLAATNADVRFAILGTEADTPAAAEISLAAPARCLNLAGQTSLLEMLAWIQLSDLVIANDTGPMHAAAAMRKPLVAVFGPTDPRRTGPYTQTEHVLQDDSLPCVPCLKPVCHFERPLACLHAISPDTVARAAQSILNALDAGQSKCAAKI